MTAGVLGGEILIERQIVPFMHSLGESDQFGFCP